MTMPWFPMSISGRKSSERKRARWRRLRYWSPIAEPLERRTLLTLTLAPLANQTVNPGAYVTAAAIATDSTAGQTLTFSLATGCLRAAINQTTGGFSWSVPSSESTGSYPITVTVTSDSTPPLSASQTFTIRVPAQTQPFVAAADIPVVPPSVDGGNQNIGDVVIGDFNNDGIPDMLVANTGGVYGLAFVPGLGGGRFGAPVYSAPGDFFSSLAVGDFSQNGQLDVAATEWGLDSVSIFLGNGNGTFTADGTYSVGQGPTSIVAADFTGTGILDLAVANETSGNVAVPMGNGDGTFQPAVDYPAGSEPWSIATGNFTGSGEPDIAVLDHDNLGTVDVLPNEGNGTFGTAISTTTGIGDPLAMAPGNFESDGSTDLAITGGSSGGGAVYVLPGVGNGTFLRRLTKRRSFRARRSLPGT